MYKISAAHHHFSGQGSNSARRFSRSIGSRTKNQVGLCECLLKHIIKKSCVYIPSNGRLILYPPLPIQTGRTNTPTFSKISYPYFRLLLKPVYMDLCKSSWNSSSRILPRTKYFPFYESCFRHYWKYLGRLRFVLKVAVECRNGTELVTAFAVNACQVCLSFQAMRHCVVHGQRSTSSKR